MPNSFEENRDGKAGVEQQSKEVLPVAQEKDSKELVGEGIETVRTLAQEHLKEAQTLANEVIRQSETDTEIAAKAQEELEKFKTGVKSLSAEVLQKIIEAGFDVINNAEAMLRLAQTKIEGAIQSAIEAGYDIDLSSKPMRGNSKIVYLLPNHKVLKLQELASHLGDVVEEKDEVAFHRTVGKELGPDARKVVADIEPAGKGVPGTIQEFVFTTSTATKIAKEQGDPELAALLETAHRSNPLAKNYLFEQKTRNTGLVLREDGRVYVVATDTTGGVQVDHVEGGWDTIRKDVAEIVTLDPARLEKIPELKNWLALMREKL